MKLSKQKIFADPWFDSGEIEFDDVNIDELLHMEHSELSSRIEMWINEGLSWRINSIIQHQLVISKITPCEGSSYFPLPKELINSRKRVINV